MTTADLRHREIAVYYKDNAGEIAVDRYTDAYRAVDRNGWLVITLAQGRGVIRYPESSVVKVREST